SRSARSLRGAHRARPTPLSLRASAPRAARLLHRSLAVGGVPHRPHHDALRPRAQGRRQTYGWRSAVTRAAHPTPRRQVTAPGGAARRRRAARLLAACIGAAPPAVADPAADAPADAAPAELEDTQDALRSEAFQSDVRAGFSRNYWVVGPTLEYFTSAA